MSERNVIEEIISDLAWMEKTAGIRWPTTDPTKLDRAAAWSIECRSHITIAAKDHDCMELVESLSEDITSLNPVCGTRWIRQYDTVRRSIERISHLS